ncbi:hypothetical protein ACOME3_000446 [Neoechinorhynchus agilis]
MKTENAYVTTALNEGEAIGAMVLGQSIKQISKVNHPDVKLCCLILRDSVSQKSLVLISKIFDEVIFLSPEQDIKDGKQEIKQAVCALQCWKLCVQFSKCVYIAPTCVLVSDIYDLFSREELSASPDSRWPDHFNTGVFVFRPNLDTYRSLVSKLFSNPDLLAACPLAPSDQQQLSCSESIHNLLNDFYSNWAHEDIQKQLPFIYNVTPNIFYSYQPALANFKNTLKIVQFCFPRPWATSYDNNSGIVTKVDPTQQEVYSYWWSMFNTHVKPLMDHENMDYVHTYTYISMPAIVEHTHTQAQHHAETKDNDMSARREWEQGNVDYMGRDSFDNIKQALDKSMN